MADKGIYTALSGAIAQSQRLDTIANNIANVNTTAFKRDQQVFQEYLTAHEKIPKVLETPRIPASIESFYSMNGGDKSYVDAAGTFTDHSQGAMKPTGNNLDLAIEGKGFFEVLSAAGPRFTRAGAFKIDQEGRLVTREGLPVLSSGTDGDDPATRVIRVKSDKVSVGTNGEIFDGTEKIGKLSLININPPDGVMKVGSSLYKLRDNFNPQVQRDSGVAVLQGFLEGSNVNVVQEMTDMIQANRSFEASQRAMKTFDELAAKVVNVVPKLE